MFHRARQKLADLCLNELERVVMIGDTMETDIRGAVEAGMLSYLVLSGSTQFEDIGDQRLSANARITERCRPGGRNSHRQVIRSVSESGYQ
ncbi:MAG: HAD hydrolase-like protein [Limisphaerales bacterium]